MPIKLSRSRIGRPMPVKILENTFLNASRLPDENQKISKAINYNPLRQSPI